MTIGIYTYGTRGDVQPYIALALALLEKGHRVILAGPADFKDFVEGFGVSFHPLAGNAEAMMNSASLIPRPADWDDSHKITGFLTVPRVHQYSYTRAEADVGKTIRRRSAGTIRRCGPQCCGHG